MFEINIIHSDGSKEYLGHMEPRHVTYNRYNEGLLIGAGKLHGSNMRKAGFLSHGAQYRNTAEMEFKINDIAYRGTFCFINFIPENQIAVFGSTGAVYEWCPIKDRAFTPDELTARDLAQSEAEENKESAAKDDLRENRNADHNKLDLDEDTHPIETIDPVIPAQAQPTASAVTP